jgi:GxxExxY protein
MNRTVEAPVERLAYSDRTEAIIGAAIEVHRNLGPGLLESVYQACLVREFLDRGIPFKQQLELPVFYKGRHVDGEFRIDLLVYDEVVVELKAIEKVLDVHEAQLLTYMRLARKPVGLLINFNVPLLSKGISRRVL